MTTSLFAANVLFAPLQQLARGISRLFTPVAPHCAVPLDKPVAQRTAPARLPQTAPRRLRVVRIVEGSPAASAGRMVISGRMADVCAELERLAALEAAHAAAGLSMRA